MSLLFHLHYFLCSFFFGLIYSKEADPGWGGLNLFFSQKISATLATIVPVGIKQNSKISLSEVVVVVVLRYPRRLVFVA